MEVIDTQIGHGPSVPYLREVLVFLLATVLVVPLLQRLRASPVLGYLFVGALIGPFGLRIISDVDGVAALAQLGVVFLLFIIGLELSLERLRAMGRLIFGLGGAQVGLSAIVIGFIAWGWGNNPEAAIILGMCLALSSTAIVTQLLVEKGEFSSRTGRTAFAVLLFQDLAVVPLLVLVNSFAGDGGSVLAALGLSLVKAAIAFALILGLGRLTLRPIFRLVARGRSPEMLMALTLLAILATAIGTEMAGLSMALGAFLAGLLLAETEFRHQVEIDIQPFKGLLLGLFFISVGMGIDALLVIDRIFWIAASVLGLIAIKAVLFVPVARLFGVPWPTAIRSALLLGTAGEFALVVVGAAMTGGVLPPDVGQFMMIVAALSMATTPFMMPLGQTCAKWVQRRSTGARAPDALAPKQNDMTAHVVIAGFGRVGQTVAQLLTDQKVPYVALDLDAAATYRRRRAGLPVYFGDASRPDVLERLGMDHAAAIVLTLDNPQMTKHAVSAIRERWPDILIYVRARDNSHSGELEELGATGIVPETLESSLALAGQVLHGLGTPMEAVNTLIDRIRDEQYVGIQQPALPDPPLATTQSKSSGQEKS